MKTSHTATGAHPPGDSIDQGRVSVTSHGPVSGICFVIPDIGHRESILVWLRMDTRYPPAGMTEDHTVHP